MSKIDQVRWNNPFTEQGLRLPEHRVGDDFRIHEVGAMVLDRHWHHEEVCSPFWRLFVAFDEGTWVRSRGSQYSLNLRRAIVLPEGLPFDCGSKDGTGHLWIHFSLPLNDDWMGASAFEIAVNPTVLEVAKVLRGITQKEQREQALRWSVALLHIVFAGIDAPTRSAMMNPRLRRVLSWIDMHMNSVISNQDLAQVARLGVEPFIRWFHKQTGKTPAAFVTEKRMREASRRLLYEDETIEDIAEAVGYRNRNHFSRVFRRYAGLGPATFRRNALNR